MQMLSQMLSNTPPPRNSRELWKHFSDTYFSLRMSLAVLAFSMPFVLWLYGQYRHGIDLQPSMSAYFWAATSKQCATFPMRTIFVGFAFAVSVGLYMYKGLTRLENSLLNAAAICALLIAIYPERLSLDEANNDSRIAQLFQNCPSVKAWAELPSLPVHYMSAATLFLLLAIVVWFCAKKSLEYLPSDDNKAMLQRRYERYYRIIAVLMIIFPVLGIGAAFLFGLPSHKLFFIEAVGILTFGLYWAVKSRELALSGLERDPAQAVQKSEK